MLEEDIPVEGWVLLHQKLMLPEPYLNYEKTLNFESFYDYLEETVDIRNINIQKTNIILYNNLELIKGTEGFIDSIKLFGSKIVNAIITIIKALINWLGKYILGIGRFIKERILYKLFGKPKNQEELENIKKAFDTYGNLPIMWNGGSTSIESTIEEVLVSHTDEEIPPLPERLKKNLSYMNFKNDNFDVINRVASLTATAVDSMKLSLESNSEGDILRQYGIIYGDKKEEDMYKTYVPKSPNEYGHKAGLYFYHERIFLEFIFHIDKLTKSNLNKLITERRYIYDNEKYGNTIENKINLNITGTDVAEAIILNCNLNDLDVLKKRAREIDLSKIKINDIISKDILLRIASGNKNTLDKLSRETLESLKIANTLEVVLDKFNKHLFEIDKRLKSENYEAIKGFIKLEETQIWIQFMVDFTARLMVYRLDMIYIIRRIIKILAKKTNNDILKNFLISDGTTNNKILGIINTYTNKTFDNLPYSKLIEEAKYISDKYIKNNYYHNNLPICIIPVREYASKLEFNLANKYGFAIPIFNSKQKIFQEIETELKSSQNENRLVTLVDKIFNINSSGPLIGIVIVINVINCKNYDEKHLWFFPPFINYYGTIIHETIHAIQCISESKTYKDKDTIANYNTELEKKIEKRRNNEYLDSKHYINAYLLTINEAEAFSKQHDFLMSTIDSKNDNIRQQARIILKKEFLIHRTYLY